MKITNTRKMELLMVDLYKCSKKKEHDADYKLANNILQFIMFCFEIISIFTNINHAEIVRKLFNKDNIIVVGIKKMEKMVFIQERTLLLYRKKYCEVIDAIFVLICEFDFFE